MTIQGGGTIYMSQINDEFGRGQNLNAYRNVQWWRDDGSTGFFSGGTIYMSDFYGKRSTAPYTPPPTTSGSQTFGGNGTFIVPNCSSLTFICEGKRSADVYAPNIGTVVTGANGGRSVWSGGVGNFGVGAGLSIIVDSTKASAFGGPSGYSGEPGGEQFVGSGEDGSWQVRPSAPGAAGGGNVVNTFGGSTQPGGLVTVQWFA